MKKKLNNNTHLSNFSIHDLGKISESKRFLGREFLTWLWYTVEKQMGILELKLGRKSIQLECWIDDHMQFASIDTRAEESTLKGGSPSRSSEANVALISGKMLKALRLGIRCQNGDEYVVSLQSDGLQPRNLTLPEPPDKLTLEGHLAFRIDKTETFLKLFDGIFRLFIAERTRQEWTSGHLEDIRDWIRIRSLQINQDTRHFM